MNKHTKGPWRAEIGPINSLIHTKDKSIACTYTANTTPEEAEANARLIAAAPELLEALIQAHDLLQGVRKYMPKSIKNRDTFHFENVGANVVNAAIRKATT